mmetsp:Transcript_11775/g.25848  ORF Transcript_11775/g.25848 Transcript_11775/m.25848 type:complete len:93 (-) Transcript_11775:373-651(-)
MGSATSLRRGSKNAAGFFRMKSVVGDTLAILVTKAAASAATLEGGSGFDAGTASIEAAGGFVGSDSVDDGGDSDDGDDGVKVIGEAVDSPPP